MAAVARESPTVVDAAIEVCGLRTESMSGGALCKWPIERRLTERCFGAGRESRGGMENRRGDRPKPGEKRDREGEIKS